MEKILVEVSLPAADLVYDLFVPDTMQVGMMTHLAASVFARLSNGVYAASPDAVLYERKTGKEYDVNARVRDTDIHNGTKLILC
ncbi:MAG: hypothetical protein LUG65_07780 [Clostridiales bacterium]|nr:hypothetical protein [Clostridiales bacterium]